MQTEQATVTLGTQLDLVGFVKEATWKDLLIDLVRKNELDPWNIEIIDIVDRYIEEVKTMRVLDLRIPANIILAAAILLRLKSEMLAVFEEEETVDGVDGERVQRPNVVVDGLTMRLRLPPKRKVALSELIAALDEAMVIKERKEHPIVEKIDVPIMISSINVEAEMERVMESIAGVADAKGMTTFSSLRSACDGRDYLLELFVPLLFLAHKERIALVQEQFFGEIIIALKQGGNNGRGG